MCEGIVKIFSKARNLFLLFIKKRYSLLTSVLLLKKGDVNGRKFERQGVDFRSASVLSRGRPMSRFTHFRSLQGLLCDANPSAKVSLLFSY